MKQILSSFHWVYITKNINSYLIYPNRSFQINIFKLQIQFFNRKILLSLVSKPHLFLNQILLFKFFINWLLFSSFMNKLQNLIYKITFDKLNFRAKSHLFLKSLHIRANSNSIQNFQRQSLQKSKRSTQNISCQIIRIFNQDFMHL